MPKAQYVKYSIQINVTITPPTIPTVPIAKPITGVTTPPPATAVIIRPEIWLAFSGRACNAIEIGRAHV